MAFIGQEYCSDNFSAFIDDTVANWHNAFDELHKLQPLGTDKEHFTVRGEVDGYTFPGQICEKVRWFADIYDGNEHGVFVQFAMDGSAKMAFRTWDGNTMSEWSEIGGTATNFIEDPSMFAIAPEMPGYVHGVRELNFSDATLTDVIFTEETPDSVYMSDEGLKVYVGIAPEMQHFSSIDIGLGVRFYSDHEQLSGYGFTLPLKLYEEFSNYKQWTFRDDEHGKAVIKQTNGVPTLSVEFSMDGGKFFEKYGNSNVYAVSMYAASVSGEVHDNYDQFMQYSVSAMPDA